MSIKSVLVVGDPWSWEQRRELAEILNEMHGRVQVTCRPDEFIAASKLSVDTVITFPHKGREHKNDYSWDTTRHARKLGLQLVIILPSGITITEGFDNGRITTEN